LRVAVADCIYAFSLFYQICLIADRSTCVLTLWVGVLDTAVLLGYQPLSRCDQPVSSHIDQAP
jgi:hypothetical protein